MVENTRRKIEKEQTTISIDDMTLEHAIIELQELAVMYGPTAMIREFQDQYDSRERLHLMTVRDETDGEMSIRIAAEKKNEEARAQYERAEFERLSKKFGK